MQEKQTRRNPLGRGEEGRSGRHAIIGAKTEKRRTEDTRHFVCFAGFFRGRLAMVAFPTEALCSAFEIVSGRTGKAKSGRKRKGRRGK